jgi:hypothetical protein
MAKERRVRERLRDPVGIDDLELPLLPARLSAASERRLASVAPGLVAAWLAGVFAACYLLIPFVLRSTGMASNAAGAEVWLQLPGFGAAGLVATVLAGLFGRVEASPAPRRIALAAGASLLAWALLHNALPGFQPFSEMSWAYLLPFVFTNAVEHLLLGLGAAGLAGSDRRAVLAALLFQLVQFGLLTLIFGLATAF